MVVFIELKLQLYWNKLIVKMTNSYFPFNTNSPVYTFSCIASAHFFGSQNIAETILAVEQALRQGTLHA